MQSVIPNSRKEAPQEMSALPWKVGSILVVSAALSLAIISLVFHEIEFSSGMLIFALLVLCFVALLHALFLRFTRNQYRVTDIALETREIELQSVFENAHDAILILDNEANCRDANPSAVQLLGVRREHLVGQSIGSFYPDQRSFDSSWKRLLTRKNDRGQSEIVRAGGERVFVEFTATANFLPDRHLISLRDVTERYRAERAKEKSLALAKSAWQEADALRTATLALTQDLRMNSVLDTLLQVLRQHIPYETAQVWLLETDTKLFLAREAMREGGRDQLAIFPETIDVSEHPTLLSVLGEPNGILMLDTLNETNWKAAEPASNTRSWLGIPLHSSGQVIGLLCAAHAQPNQFTTEHLRIGRSLAISASVAIQNARLYERAEIYASELNRHRSSFN